MSPLPTANHYIQELRALTATEAKRKWREDIKNYWGNRCCYCGSTENLTLDHVHPKARGGHDITRNVVPACLSCNQSKGSSHWLSWWVNQDSFDLSNFSKLLAWATT